MVNHHPHPATTARNKTKTHFNKPPLGSGLFVLLTLATGYVFTKSFRREAKEPNQ
jgi:hypothetical protein